MRIIREYRQNHPAYDDRTSYDFQREWAAEDRRSKRHKQKPEDDDTSTTKHVYPKRVMQITQPSDGNTDVYLTAQLMDDDSVVVFLTYGFADSHPVHKVLWKQHKDNSQFHFDSGVRIYFEKSCILDALDEAQTIVRDARRLT